MYAFESDAWLLSKLSKWFKVIRTQATFVQKFKDQKNPTAGRQGLRVENETEKWLCAWTMAATHSKQDDVEGGGVIQLYKVLQGQHYIEQTRHDRSIACYMTEV